MTSAVRLVLASSRPAVVDPLGSPAQLWWSSIVVQRHADLERLGAELGILIHEARLSHMVDPTDATLFAVDADDDEALWCTLRGLAAGRR